MLSQNNKMLKIILASRELVDKSSKKIETNRL